jgi:coenzyme F420-0:L-glutamate ligase/coenzyme F420-1:gamma-L-glutamate ligase
MHCHAIEGLPEIRPGDDLAALIEERFSLRDDDVVCVASTIVSKAEDRAFDLSAFPAGKRARSIAARLEEIAGEEKDPRFAQAVIEESEELVLETPFLLAATRFGHVAPNAGVDTSNVPNADVLLLPEAPAASAERIRSNLETDAGVIVTDTCGRPFRHGQTGVAIGYAGLPATRDWRGETDRDGHELEVTNESIVDELAATANLLTGEGDDGVPVVVIRDFAFGDHEGSDRLFRDAEEDLVRDALGKWEYESWGPESAGSDGDDTEESDPEESEGST